MWFSFNITIYLFTLLLATGVLSQGHGDLRLAGYGSNLLAGRLEIFFEGQWGAVCGGVQFNRLSASVACRQLGLGPAINVVYYPDLRFGIGDLESKISDVICIGSESHILQCHTSVTKCPRYQYVGIVCSQITLPYSGSVRVVNFQSFSSNGYLKLYLNGHWRSVCGDSFNEWDAKSACRQLGYTSGTYELRVLSPGISTWVLSSSCLSNHICVSTCGIIVGSSDCTQGVILNCTFNSTSINKTFGNQSACEVADQRTFNGNIQINSSISHGVQGVPEVYLDSGWRKVCSHTAFDINEADVICKQLSYTFAVRYTSVSGSPSIGAMIACNGLEHSLTNCSLLNTSQCSYFIDLKCNNEEPVYGSLKLVNGAGASGSLFVFNGRQFQPVCDTGFGFNELNVVCRQLGYQRGIQIVNNSLYTVSSNWNGSFHDSYKCAGYENYLLECEKVSNRLCRYPYDLVAVQCSAPVSQKIRLIGGSNVTSGRLEVSIGNVWGTVCGFKFNHFAAHVACRQLGYETVNTYSMTRETIASPILITSLWCSGFESDLLSCPHNIADNGTCQHINDVYLDCSLEYPLSDGKLRIVQNSSSNLNSGRLEIAYHGIWMPVCGKFFTKEAADVSCRQIGYSYAQSYCTNACNGTGGSTYVFFAETHCSGNELKLIECEQEVHNSEHCSEESYVSITCVHNEITPTPSEKKSDYPSLTITEGIPGDVEPTSKFFLPISEPMFYSLTGVGCVCLIICIACTLGICCCLCCRKKRTYWETHSSTVASVNGHINQDNIYDSPQFDYLCETKDSCDSWKPYVHKVEEETDFGHDPPRYDEINFSIQQPSHDSHTYEGLTSSASLKHNGSSEKMLDS